MIADQLGIPYYDSELLEQAAVKSGLSKQFFESHDEKVASVSMLYGYSGFISNQYGSIEKMANKAQKEIIEEVASKGPCVIVGRRADQILKDRENLFRVFITAPLNARVQHVMEREDMSEQESREKILRVDKERARYYDAFALAKWGGADNYDLCVDTTKVGIQRTVDMIAGLVKNR
jgi:cytidylate kinase